MESDQWPSATFQLNRRRDSFSVPDDVAADAEDNCDADADDNDDDGDVEIVIE